MLLDLHTASKIDKDIEVEDILSLEAAIRAYSNNKFHRPGYVAEVTRISGNKVYFDAPVNLFAIDDTIEINGVQYVDGFHVVKDVLRGQDENYIEIELPFEIDMEYEGNGGMIFQIAYPADVKAGAKHVLEQKVKMAKNQGIKSKSVSRLTITYDTADANSQTVYGLASNQFDFLAPYMRMGWE